MGVAGVRICCIGILLAVALAASPPTASARCPGVRDVGSSFSALGVTGANSQFCGSDVDVRLLNPNGLGDTEGQVGASTRWSGTFDGIPGRLEMLCMRITTAANPDLVGMYRQLDMFDGGPPVEGQPSHDFVYGHPPVSRGCGRAAITLRPQDRMKSGDIDIDDDGR
jgi:hypothetical protein